jgi:hypothetical protein
VAAAAPQRQVVAVVRAESGSLARRAQAAAAPRLGKAMMIAATRPVAKRVPAASARACGVLEVVPALQAAARRALAPHGSASLAATAAQMVLVVAEREIQVLAPLAAVVVGEREVRPAKPVQLVLEGARERAGVSARWMKLPGVLLSVKTAEKLVLAVVPAQWKAAAVAA